MPTILRVQGYRMYFYSHEPNEPPHIHVDRERMSAKFWIESVALEQNRGFSPRELRQLERLVEVHQTELMEANEYFSNRS